MGPQLGAQDMSVTVSSMEASVAASVKLLDNLSLGVSWRVTYSAMSMDMLQAPLPGVYMRAKGDYSGISAVGARVGLHYAPTPTIKLGLTYTSKVNAELTGKTNVTILNGPEMGRFNTYQDLASPHALRAGGSVSLLDDKLLVALDLKALFYAESNKKAVVKMENVPNFSGPPKDEEQVQRQDWKNVYSANLGLQYKVIDLLALRAGYSLSNSATPEKTANPMGFGPGLINTFHAGLGVQAMDTLSIDLGAFYVMHSHDIKTTRYNNAGSYSMDLIVGALSATYRR